MAGRADLPNGGVPAVIPLNLGDSRLRGYSTSSTITGRLDPVFVTSVPVRLSTQLMIRSVIEPDRTIRGSPDRAGLTVHNSFSRLRGDRDNKAFCSLVARLDGRV